LLINGEWVDSQTDTWYDVRDPATQELVTRVPQATPEELKEAARAAELAFKDWRKQSILTRQKLMLDLQYAIRENMVSYFMNQYDIF
jgi:malonate-semialdehyde dehydrogenase (acetylating)/methylmalonate-semialdehyde dehydrogenase